MFKSFLLELNISAVKTNYIFSVNSNDLNTIRLDLVVKDGSDVVDLTGKIVRLAVRKPDNTVVFQSGGVTDGTGGKCEFILSNQASLVPGRHEGEVMIYEGDSTVAVTTKFYYEVKRAVLTNEDVESSSDFPAISQAIAAGEILKEIDIHSVIEAGAIAGGVQEEMNLAKQKEDGTLFGTVQERLNDNDKKLLEKVTYIDSVTTLKSTNKFKENDVVVTLGYYDSNDGGGGTFIIKSASLTPDDGSVIALTNGKQAHLIPTGFVNYRQFGAKLDGDIARVTTETTAIKNAHTYANAKELPVKQNNGLITLNNTVTVQTDTDLTGCSILIKSYSKDKTLYNITSKKPVISVAGYTQSELAMGATQIPSLSSYKHHMITIVSDQLLSERNDAGIVTPTYRKDSFFLTRDGAFISGKLIQDFTTGALTITARPYEEKRLVFKGPKIVWDFQNASSTCTVISLERGNTELNDMFLDIPNVIDYDDAGSSGYKGQVFNVQNAYKVKVSNIVAENVTEGSAKSGYIMNMNNVLDVTFERLTWLNGWGVTGTNNVKDWKVFDSQINRIDAHTGTGDLYCRNVEFVGGWGVFLGYGDGTVTLDDCTSDFLNIDGRQFDSVVFLGVSYGVIYRGNVVIRNHTIKSKTNRSKNLLTCDFSGTGIDYKLAYDLKLPNLIAKDIYIEGTGSEQFFGYMMKGFDSMVTSLVNNNKNVILPSVIDISSVALNIDSDTSYFEPVYLLMTNTTVAGRTRADSPKIRIRDVFQSIDSKFRNGFTTADLGVNVLPKKLIYMTLPKETAPTTEFDISINNCGGSAQIEVNSGTIKILNSEIAFDVEGTIETSPNRLIVRDCEWFLNANSAKTASLLINTNLDGRDNIIYVCKKDGAPLLPIEYNLAGGAKKLKDNVFTEQTVSAAITDKYWKYIDTTVYKSPTAL